MDLTDFLLARIAEDEAVAQAAVLGPWSAVEGSSGAWWVEHPHTADIAIDLHGENARHIARHDPARVLAECEAKRRIVDIMQAFESAIGAQSNERTIGSLNGLRIAVKELALPYADHPDCREEWKP